MISIPLLIADGDIPTTHLFARVLRAAHGSVETRYAKTLFGTEVDRSHVVFSRFCRPSHAWLPHYLATRDVGYLYLIDDNFWALTPDIDPHLAAFYAHPAVVETLDTFVRGSRATVVWSKRLGEAIRARLPETRVEYLNPPFDTDKANALLQSAGSRAVDGDVVRIGYPTSRRPGVAPLLEPVVRHVAQRYPGRVVFEFVGWMPDGVADVPGVTLFQNMSPITTGISSSRYRAGGISVLRRCWAAPSMPARRASSTASTAAAASPASTAGSHPTPTTSLMAAPDCSSTIASMPGSPRSSDSSSRRTSGARSRPTPGPTSSATSANARRCAAGR